jgi:glycosyltransferase involved in cell wall biosynthesis
MSSQKLSIVMPVYNEMGTIADIVANVRNALPDVAKELVIVDDGSRDGTREWLTGNFGHTNIDALDNSAPKGEPPGGHDSNWAVRVLFHARNSGKGAAVRNGLRACTGDVVVIQDSDLEYDPSDWTRMYDLIVTRKVADVVYGSRFYGLPHRSLYYHHYVGNRLISRIYNLLYNQTLNDVEVCYKMFTREVLHSLALTCNDFGIEIEISAQIAMARRWRIYEVGIHYYGRTYEEGKKIDWGDGVKALWYLVKFRFSRPRG